jgi:hypothetical protein
MLNVENVLHLFHGCFQRPINTIHYNANLIYLNLFINMRTHLQDLGHLNLVHKHGDKFARIRRLNQFINMQTHLQELDV